MHSRQNNLLDICIEGRLDIADDLCHRPAASRSARDGGNAESAFVIAAILDLYEGASALAAPRDWLAFLIFNLQLVEGNIEQVCHQAVFALVGDHAFHSGEFGHRIWFNGRQATCDDDFADSSPVSLAHFLPRIGGRGGGHRAGIEHHHVCFFHGGNQLVPGGCQLAGVRFNLALI